MKKENRGITLIALIVTIIVLLILAGIMLSLISGSNGILKKAVDAREETIKAQYEEELEMILLSMKTDALLDGKRFTMEYIIENLPAYLEKEGKTTNYSWDNTQTLEEPEGEYKDYEFWIDTNYVVHVENAVGGIKPEITADLLTTEYVLTGNTVEIQVITSITEGSVTVTVPEGVTQKSVTGTDQNKTYIFTVDKNGKYAFTAVSDSGRKARKTVGVNLIIEKPTISITNITKTSMMVNVTNHNMEGLTYHYYLNGNIVASNKTEKSYETTNLESATTYKVKVGAIYKGTELISDEVDGKTLGYTISDAVEYWPLKENLNNRVSTSSTGNFLAKGTGTVSFEEGGVHLSGNEYLETGVNYVFPSEFTVIIQMKKLNCLPESHGWYCANILGQGSYSNINASSGQTSYYVGLHWDNYYPNVNSLASWSSRIGSSPDSSISLKGDVWGTIAWKYASNQQTLYVNGTKVGPSIKDSFNVLQEPLSISKPNTGFTYLNGCYRNVIIFKSALSDGNIADIIKELRNKLEGEK